MKVMYLILACCLVLTACGSKKKEMEMDHSTMVMDANHKPTMEVKTEVKGTELDVDVTTNMMISPEHYGMARENGEGHIHMYLDNGEKIGVKEGHKVFKDLKPGPHILKISLHNNDHTPYDVTQTVEFDIK
ncbi:hypothetical protein EHS13_04640 [Paenibacillus psychroresistens]|uniref:YtkA-like domain-containing protein n=1 Tax=Paenibacillus psychroresistens TaxID=1778678 RepID=A0A6B8REU7_9BACL|nr:hypothetical protein [Paenibacillus psychroresistens]QGQ94244.1 hypothetical protein EHS13_04640 [Paenibacillus psychroresistens]